MKQKKYKLNYPELKDYPNKINYKNWFTEDEFIEKYPIVIYWCFRFNYYFKQFPNFNG